MDAYPSSRPRVPRAGALREAAALVVVLVALTLGTSAANAQGTVTGRVVSAGTGEPIPGATVAARILASADSGGVVRQVESDAEGRYRLAALPPGAYAIEVRRVGYRAHRVNRLEVSAGATELDVTLERANVRLAEIVVTPGRDAMTLLEAPAPIHSISGQEVRERPALTVAEHTRGVPGVDVMRIGLVAANVTTRGFGNVFSGALLVLTDHRIASVPSLRVNAFYLIPNTSEDIERMEVVLGPASALYGPNSANGILHILTRSPFDEQGTTISVSGGGRSVAQLAMRNAGTVGDRFGWKITGQYMQGDDWQSVDSLEIRARQDALADGADPDTLLIGRRSYDVERWTWEGRLDFRPREGSELTLGAGSTTAGSAIEMTGLGAAQVEDWRYSYYQLRGRAGDFFAQAFINESDAGDTYLLRTGQSIVDRSRMYVAQLQHGVSFGERLSLNYGLDLQRTDPRTEGTITGRNEGRDRTEEIGGYVQSDLELSDRIDLVTALRLDDHSHLEDPVWSPRAAIVFMPTESQAIRLTWNRAFTTPTTNHLFLDLLALPDLRGLPFPVRTVGVPEGGLRFRRDCAGGLANLCMRSPAAFGAPNSFLPTDATLFWEAVGEVLHAQSGGAIDIRGVPAPNASQVATVLRLLNTSTGAFAPADPAAIRDVEQLRPTVNNVFEIGYRGAPTDRIRLSADIYFERKNDFIGPLLVETPNAFLDSAGVADYLEAVGYPPANAQVIAGFATRIPVGTITPDDELTSSPELLLTYRNFGTVELWGGDLSVEADVTDRLTLTAAYSHVSDDFFSRQEVGGLSDIALNAPRHKGAIGARFRDATSGVTIGARQRFIASFPMNSGVYIGDVESASMLDLSLGWTPPRLNRMQLSLDVSNVLDRRHRQAVGAPELGRHIMTKVQYSF